jgi:galactokinase
MPGTPREIALEHGRRSFGPDWQPAAIAEAPGRLELLGNHVDYNGGLVLAGAIDRVVCVLRGDGAAQGEIELVAGDVTPVTSRFLVADCREWKNATGRTGPAEYAMGVIAALLERDLGVHDRPRLAIAGNVPLGFGMSSSAGLCVALVMALSESPLDQLAVITIAREAEHRCGNPVGAMDQSASVAGGVILFDGRSTSYQAMSPDLGDYLFAVADSGIRHALGDSSYAMRVQESQEALAWLRANWAPGIDSLGDLDPAQWQAIQEERDVDKLGSVLTRRVDHVVSEIARVRRGVVAVEGSDWASFGQLMIDSGESSNALYEISHPVVEDLVGQLNALDGVAGARMMGGGEGGPALALIHRDALDGVAAALEHGFFRHHPSHLQGVRLQVCAFGPGAHVESWPA